MGEEAHEEHVTQQLGREVLLHHVPYLWVVEGRKKGSSVPIGKLCTVRCARVDNSETAEGSWFPSAAGLVADDWEKENGEEKRGEIVDLNDVAVPSGLDNIQLVSCDASIEDGNVKSFASRELGGGALGEGLDGIVGSHLERPYVDGG